MILLPQTWHLKNIKKILVGRRHVHLHKMPTTKTCTGQQRSSPCLEPLSHSLQNRFLGWHSYLDSLNILCYTQFHQYWFLIQVLRWMKIGSITYLHAVWKTRPRGCHTQLHCLCSSFFLGKVPVSSFWHFSGIKVYIWCEEKLIMEVRLTCRLHRTN